MAKETKKFQAEVKQILDLMIHSLYSQKEIFLRELVSNASDAIDKVRFESLSNSDWNVDSGDFHIRLTPDAENKILVIEDNGIGMSYEEVEKNIGTIAHSGTGAFLKNLKEAQEKPELIGQFGVGFYSAFMVANKIVVETQRPNEKGVRWESTGDGTYSIEDYEREGLHGTTIKLFLKDDLDQDFTSEWTLKQVIKAHSNFISFPIKMKIEKETPELDKDGKPIEGKTLKTTEDEVLNSQKAIWTKRSSEVTDQEYNDFYRHVANDWTDPLKSIHFNVEGSQEFSALLFCPSQPPMNFNVRDQKWGLQLYVKRVLITDHCEEVLPSYLRFIKGVVDSSDLSLNVSREILQQDHQVQAIKKALTSKVLRRFKDWLADDRENYEKLWKSFGATIKEGVHIDFANKDKIVDVLLFNSNKDSKLITLAEYIENKPEEQKSIYYMSGENIEELQKSPLLEKFNRKGFDVILLTDAVDEWLTSALDKYKDIPMQSILDESLEIDSEEEKKENEEKLKAAEKDLEPILNIFKEQLKESVKEVRLSNRLVSSPVCLVSSSNDPSARMERIMNAMGQSVPAAKRILEINPDHKIVKKMQSIDSDQQFTWAKVLYTQALLQEGSPIENPIDFSKDLSKVMSSFQ